MKTLSCSAISILVLAACGGGDFQSSQTGGATGSGGIPGTGGAAQTGGTANGGTGTGGLGTGGAGTGGADAGSTDGSVSCTDEDGDNQTTCAGDCDDNDSLNFTGNPEICGDQRDNDCSLTADEICNDLGTFVSTLKGDDTWPGTITQPVKTIAVGMAHAQTIGNGVDVYVGQGTYPEKVTMLDGISLLGGFACTASSCTWDRDVENIVTEIVATDFEGVLIGHSVGRETLLDGFTIRGLGGLATNGTAAVTIRGGAPTIVRNTIVGGDVSSGTVGRSVGVAILSDASAAPAGPLVTGNSITGGASPSSTSIGLLFDTGLTAGLTYGTLRANEIAGGTGASSVGMVAWNSDASVRVEMNSIAGGVSTGANGSAWGVLVGSAMTLNRNGINISSVPTCATVSNWCGGIMSESATLVVTNNLIVGADATWSSGVSLTEMERAAGAVILNANYIHGGGPGAVTVAVRLHIGSCTACGTSSTVGSIRNNILDGGSSTLSRFGVYETIAANGLTQHPVALENNWFYLPTIGVGDGLYRFHDGANATLLKTISEVNNLANVVVGSPIGGNLEGDPLFSSGKLQAGSPCIDKGTSTEAPSDDFDGETRPRGSAIDIGPDEAG